MVSVCEWCVCVTVMNGSRTVSFCFTCALYAASTSEKDKLSSRAPRTGPFSGHVFSERHMRWLSARKHHRHVQQTNNRQTTDKQTTSLTNQAITLSKHRPSPKG